MAKQSKQAIPKWYVTAEMLLRKGACGEQRERFLRTFGTGKVYFNKKNWDKAQGAGLSIWWLAWQTLPNTEYDRIMYRTGYMTSSRRTNMLFNALERKRLNTRITI